MKLDRALSVFALVCSLLALGGVAILWMSQPESFISGYDGRPVRTTGITGAVVKSLVATTEAAPIYEQAEKLGLACSTLGPEACTGLIKRASANPKLKEALLKAKESSVPIYPSGHFFVGEGVVGIDPKANDESIISFLIK